MRRYIAATFRYAPLDGLRYQLRVPRMTAWTHPLWRCVNAGDVPAVQKLFSEGMASPLDVNPRGANAMIYIGAHEYSEMGLFLLENGTDADFADEGGRKPVELLCQRFFSKPDDEYNNVIGSILSMTDFINTRDFSVVHKILLGLINWDLRSELMITTASVNSRDTQGRTPLSWATIRNDLGTVDVLLEFGADPNIVDNVGHTCLHFVESPAVFRALVLAGANVHALTLYWDWSPLHALCKRTGHQNVELIDCFISSGVDVNVRDFQGETPLSSALFRGQVASAKRLMELGADVNAANWIWKSGDSALHFAVMFNAHHTLPLLLKKGADYTATNFSGANILHMAAQMSDAVTLQILADSNLEGLIVDLTDHPGKTAREYLAERQFLTGEAQSVQKGFENLLRSLEDVNKGVPPLIEPVLDPEKVRDLPGSYPDM